MIKDTCRKCGTKLIPSLADGNDFVCPKCKREYGINFSQRRTWAGVG